MTSRGLFATERRLESGVSVAQRQLLVSSNAISKSLECTDSDGGYVAFVAFALLSNVVIATGEGKKLRHAA